MRRRLWLLAALAALLIGGSLASASGIDAARARAEPTDYFSEGYIQRAERYRSTRYVLGFSALGLSIGAAALLGLGLGSRALGAWSAGVTGRWWLQAPLLAAVVILIPVLVKLPLSMAAYRHDRAFGLATNSLAGHLSDVAKASGFELVIGGVTALAFIGVARWLPRGWPAVAIAGGIVLTFVLVYLFPIVYEPAFNTFRPVSDPVRERVLRLADRAGVEVREVLVADASRRTTRKNAYVSGIGSSKRVVLYDTLLAGTPPDQVDFVVAHELAHDANNDVLKGAAYASAGVLVGIIALWWLFSLTSLTRWLGVAGPGDPRAVPFLALFIAAATLVTMPAVNAISRSIEARADREAIALTADPQAAIDLHVTLAKDNLSDVTPNGFVVWAFFTHPPVLDRIEHALEAPS